MDHNQDSLRGWNVQQLEESRERLHQNIDKQYDDFVVKVLTNGCPELVPEGERLLSMATAPVRFKGMKPTGICFPGGRTVSVTKWTKAVTEIMRECNADDKMHTRMMALRDRLGGRFRCLLSSDAASLSVPLKIDEGLYLEGKLDTEYLLKTITREIMDRIGYDYSRIGILIRDPEQEMVREQAQANTMRDLN